MATRLDHLILPVDDYRASLDFCFRLLGFTDEGATERRI